ncbi:glycosyltransferase [Coraliomargarita parva]|uniref:glycosyltransferase n=1 Tax=Coraliomargarita parva TaxID=3014050 RepID=UPI0022B36685|nr:glycosyltransferase [Coraliomargarita parva]
MNPRDQATPLAIEASVVIPCYNAATTLAEQLEALACQTFSGVFEVVLVDNASTDNSAEIAASYADRFASLRVVRATRLKGAGYARNVGVEAAKSEYVLFCDADDVVSVQWVASMVAALQAGCLVGGGRDFRRLNADWHPVLRDHPEDLDSHTVCDVHYSGGLSHVGAGNMGVHRSLFLELGGFDQLIPIHEDVDFCIRAQLAGHELKHCPEAMVYIRVRQCLGAVFRQARVWGYWSVALLKKHRATLGDPPIFRPLLHWPLLILRVAQVRDRGDFYLWTYRVGWKIGRLFGSLMMGFFAL